MGKIVSPERTAELLEEFARGRAYEAVGDVVTNHLTKNGVKAFNQRRGKMTREWNKLFDLLCDRVFLYISTPRGQR